MAVPISANSRGPARSTLPLPHYLSLDQATSKDLGTVTQTHEPFCVCLKWYLVVLIYIFPNLVTSLLAISTSSSKKYLFL